MTASLRHPPRNPKDLDVRTRPVCYLNQPQSIGRLHPGGWAYHLYMSLLVESAGFLASGSHPLDPTGDDFERIVPQVFEEGRRRDKGPYSSVPICTASMEHRKNLWINGEFSILKMTH